MTGSAELTFETPAPGVVIAQPARGFRYTSDAMWLTGFALDTPDRPRQALDLGTGSGVIALLLAAHGIPVVGIDRDPDWGPAWTETLARSQVSAPVALRCADLRDGVEGTYDLVVANPPYFAAGTGPTSPDPQRRSARTESGATLTDFLRIGGGCRSEHGRLCVIVPREREPEVVSAAIPIERWARVGQRRTLFALGSGSAAPEHYDERSDVVLAWVRAANGAPPRWR